MEIKERAFTKLNLFVFEGMGSPYLLAIDGAILKLEVKVVE